jgi:DNA polymerase-3 subunit beta
VKKKLPLYETQGIIMKFTMASASLTMALTYLANCVEKKAEKPILANVLLELSNQVLTLTTNNINAEMVFKLDVEDFACEDGSVTTDIKKLLQICKVTKKDINFNLKDDNLLVNYGKTKYKLQTLPTGDFPNIDPNRNDKSINFKVDTKALTVELNRVSFAMANKDVRTYLNGMQWLSENGNLRLVSTDGHRLAVSSLNVEAPDFNIIMPRDAILDIKKLMAEMGVETNVIITDSYIQLKSEGYQYTSKLIDGKFPDIDRVIPKNNNVHVDFDKASLKTLITQCLLASDDSDKIKLSFENGHLEVTSQNNRETSSCEISTGDIDKKIEINFNGSYLIDAISNITGDDVVFSLLDEKTTTVIRSANDDNYKFVVMPLKAG